MDRRKFIVLAAVLPLAGCTGDDPTVDELLETGESTSFEAEAGEELDVTVAAGEAGVTAVIEHEDGADNWEWTLAEDEEMEDTITPSEDGEYIVAVEEGSAFITVD